MQAQSRLHHVTACIGHRVQALNLLGGTVRVYLHNPCVFATQPPQRLKSAQGLTDRADVEDGENPPSETELAMKIGTAADTLVKTTTNGVGGQAKTGNATVGKTSGTRDAVSSGVAASGGGSTVALSSTATALLHDVNAATPEFDAGKVTRISQAITDGKFSVDAAVIADKLIANAKELLGRAVA
jgi:negative regulator of flagellin synthesis FlgM